MHWVTNASYNYWTVVSTPRVHSIAVFPLRTNGAGPVGHVAWVTGVSAGNITITKMNYAAWNTVDTRTLTPAGFSPIHPRALILRCFGTPARRHAKQVDEGPDTPARWCPALSGRGTPAHLRTVRAKAACI